MMEINKHKEHELPRESTEATTIAKCFGVSNFGGVREIVKLFLQRLHLYFKLGNLRLENRVLMLKCLNLGERHRQLDLRVRAIRGWHAVFPPKDGDEKPNDEAERETTA